MGAQLCHRRLELGAGALLAEFRVGNTASVAVRIAEVLAGPGHPVELVVGHIVPQHVAPVVGEPELAGGRVPVEAHRIAHPLGHDLQVGAVGLHLHDVGVAVFVGRADIAGGADRHIQIAIRAKGDKLPSVMRFGGEAIAYHNGLGRVVQAGIDVIQADDPRGRGGVKRAVAEGHAYRHGQAGGDGPELRGGRQRVADCIHLAFAAGADKERAPRRQGHATCFRHLRAQQFDAKAWRQLDLLQRQGGVGIGTEPDRCHERRESAREQGPEAANVKVKTHGALSCRGFHHDACGRVSRQSL